MGTLADSFLADLEDLSDDAPEENDEDDVNEEGEDLEMEDIEALDYDNLKSVAKLSSDKHYHEVMQRVRDAVQHPEQDEGARVGPLEDDPTYKLLVECNKLAVDIDNEIAVIHNFIRDRYRLKFPELESLVHHPIDYARVVQRIGNEMDLMLVDLEELLPAATIMMVTVTATTTTGRPLSEDNLRKVLDGCEMALGLDKDKAEILEYVKSKMHKIAPNLSAALGSEVAARLMGVAGGLINLSRMPACNIQVLGAKRRNLAGFSAAASQPHQGFITGSQIIQSTPPALRSKAARLVGGKAALLARVDACGQDPTGATGEKMGAEMMAKIEKWQEPPPAKIIKPLPAPDGERKKRRGGKRQRKMKERYGVTEMRKAANRVNFNQPEDEFLDGDEVVGLGVLGKEGSGRLRVVMSQQKMKLSAKTAKKFKQRNLGSSGATNGLASTVAFSTVQGIEFENPDSKVAELDTRSGTESYFSDLSGFRSLRKPGV